VPFEQAHDGDLAHSARAGDDASLLAIVHETSASADVGFVSLNLSAHLVEAAALHGEPDAVQEEPRRLLRHANRPRQFAGANTVLRAGEQPDGRQPLIEADRRVFHDGADLHGELLLRVLIFAAPDAARFDEVNVHAATGRAGDGVILPAELDGGSQADIRVSEIPDSFLECFGPVLSCHTESMADLAL
jgi:hypothetical protein